MKKVLILLLFGLFAGPLSISAQNASAHNHLNCGTSVEDQQVLYNSMVELRKRYPNVTASRAISYIPVWFHMVAKSDGTGGTTASAVSNMLCSTNKIFEDNGLEMQFYIAGISEISLDALYNNSPGAFASENRINATKKADAMNIYMVNNPNTAQPGVLAYYTNGSNYVKDYIVCANSQVNSLPAYTLVHEIGHMFTLAHTFFGWEDTNLPTAAAPCAPTTVSYLNQSFQVEKVARTGPSKNCDVAADGFCDTPEDYNFGYTWNGAGCAWSGVVKDPDCVAVNPDETNIMGYFLSCLKNFSTEQKNAIRNNFLNHPKRAYLRNGSTSTTVSTAVPTLISPSVSATTPFFNNIQLDWSDVTGAVGYSVDVSRFSSFGSVTKSYFVTTSDLNVNALNSGTLTLAAGFTYYWRVTPIFVYKNCGNVSITGNFRTGTVNDVKEITGVTHFSVSPNPLSKTQNLSLDMTSETAFDANVKLFNITGQLMRTERRRFAAGYSTQPLSIADLTNGTYILTVESEKGVLNKRVVIQ